MNKNFTAILALMAAGLKIKIPYVRAVEKNYIPAGPNKNVKGTHVKNPKQAEQMNTMYKSWAVKRSWYENLRGNV